MKLGCVDHPSGNESRANKVLFGKLAARKCWESCVVFSMLSVPNTIVTCSYIADASTTGSNGKCHHSGEKYRKRYLNAMDSYCKSTRSRRTLEQLQRCCHSNLTVMLHHHQEIRRRVAGHNRCVRGIADSMNQVQIIFGPEQIRAIFVRQNSPGFAAPWKSLLPGAFQKATGRKVPLVQF